jgi:hypothetical protein
MQYETPECQEMGEVDELVEVIYGGPDLESSTGKPGYSDYLW